MFCRCLASSHILFPFAFLLSRPPASRLVRLSPLATLLVGSNDRISVKQEIAGRCFTEVFFV
jgi:hypothetical protein